MLHKNKITAALIFSIISAPSFANPNTDKCFKDWIEKDDKAFAAQCADMAFSDNLRDREYVAWMLFLRANQLIDDKSNVSATNKVPQWMAWATDSDTFGSGEKGFKPSFTYSLTNRDDLQPVAKKKKLLVGEVSTAGPDSANEEVTRNAISYNYLVQNKLYTKSGVIDYINTKQAKDPKAANPVDMPVGTFEAKASWLKVPEGKSAPEGALTYKFDSGTYWWRGFRIMVKMKPLPQSETLYYTEDPSWFWATFEFDRNPGVEHVRDTFITQRAPLSKEDIKKLLKESGLKGSGLENYSPNGTQIRYTAYGDINKPVILGHTNMEDFAGWPNTAQPQYWKNFNSSCHTCHATAAINPKTGEFFPFTVPIGKLTPEYYGADAKGNNLYLGDGFVPLDFMWPIPFQAK